MESCELSIGLPADRGQGKREHNKKVAYKSGQKHTLFVRFFWLYI